MSARLRFKVRAQASMFFPGWEARAKRDGLRVTSAPASFGRISYIVKSGILAVAFESARGSESEWTAPSSALPLVQSLASVGIAH